MALINEITKRNSAITDGAEISLWSLITCPKEYFAEKIVVTFRRYTRANKNTRLGCVIVDREREKKEEKRSIIMLFVSICCVTCGYPVAPQNVLCNAHVTLEMPPYHGKGRPPCRASRVRMNYIRVPRDI